MGRSFLVGLLLGFCLPLAAQAHRPVVTLVLGCGSENINRLARDVEYRFIIAPAQGCFTDWFMVPDADGILVCEPAIRSDDKGNFLPSPNRGARLFADSMAKSGTRLKADVTTLPIQTERGSAKGIYLIRWQHAPANVWHVIGVFWSSPDGKPKHHPFVDWSDAERDRDDQQLIHR